MLASLHTMLARKQLEVDVFWLFGRAGDRIFHQKVDTRWLFSYTGVHLPTVLSRIELIWISHMHADHHLGLLRIMEGRAKAQKDLVAPADRTELIVVGPKSIEGWLKTYLKSGLQARHAFCTLTLL